MEPYDRSQPTPTSITSLITDRYPGVFVAEAMNASFFSRSDKHWPNFATIVTTDEHDTASDLSRPGTFRLNIGVTGATFDRLTAAVGEPDFTAFDRLFPHPVYAAQHWIGIVNPTTATFETVVIALLDEAHERLAAQQARHAGKR
ncbi:MAG TPA: DUF6194 family protein [Candidatus Limnocylindrales bacterium]